VWRGAGHLQGARQCKIIAVRNLSGDATGTVLIIALRRVKALIAKLDDQSSTLLYLYLYSIVCAPFSVGGCPVLSPCSLASLPGASADHLALFVCPNDCKSFQQPHKPLFSERSLTPTSPRAVYQLLMPSCTLQSCLGHVAPPLSSTTVIRRHPSRAQSVQPDIHYSITIFEGRGSAARLAVAV
jgi:hypothetical protein